MPKKKPARTAPSPPPSSAALDHHAPARARAGGASADAAPTSAEESGPARAREAARLLEQAYELVEVGSLVPHPDNPNRGDVAAIAESVEANGFYGACIVQKSRRRVLVGHHRLEAARRAGLPTVPAILIDCDDEAALRILLADNRTAELAKRPADALAAILKHLPNPSRGTGYKAPDVSKILESYRPSYNFLAPATTAAKPPADDDAEGEAPPGGEYEGGADDDEAAPSSRAPDRSKARHALAIVLDNGQKRAWDTAKKRLGEKSDTKALLRLLEQAAEAAP